MKKVLLFFLISFCSFNINAVILKRIFLNGGTFITVDGKQFPYLAFNETKIFSATNAVLNISGQDTLAFIVINNDSLKHQFSVQGDNYTSADIKSGDSITYKFKTHSNGLYLFYDPLNQNAYMGAAGMLCISDYKNDKKYYWNLKEHEQSFNRSLSHDSSVNWKQYNPDYFTINGLSYPDIENDPSAVVQGNVGDTIHIFTANTGISMHSLHFHGYHVKIVWSNDKQRIGWIKDTYLMNSMQTFILELVPDKKGMYPVHDHNLVAMCGGKRSMKGMMLILNIK